MIEFGDRLLTLAGVPPEKIQECLAWAFGEFDENESMDELRKKWNARHSDIFVVSQKDNIKAFVWSLGKAYMIHNYTNSIVRPVAGRFN